MTLPSPVATRKFRMILGKLSKVLFIILVLALPVWLISRLFVGPKPEAQVAGATDSGDAVIEGPLATMPVNYDFSFGLSDSEEEGAPRLLFSVIDAELRKEILVKGKKATAIEGRAFLVLDLKVTNSTDQGVEISTRDFFRLSKSENESEWLAPDIHNDPVEVQAISTKYTRIGFPINQDDKSLILQVGHINGEKTQLPLNFQ